MKKLLIVLALLLVGLIGVSAQGQELDELTAMAAYAPQDSAFFAAVRTDDGYIDTWDALIADVVAKLPEGAVPPEGVAVRDLLTQLFFPPRYDYEASEMVTPEETFVDDVRPWLGDTVAIYLVSVNALLMGGDEQPPLVIAVDITDMATADAFVNNSLAEDIEEGSYTREEQAGGNITYMPSYTGEAEFMVTEEVLFIGLDIERNIVMPGDDLVNLGQTETFQSAVNALPEDAYNVLVYVDAAQAVDTLGTLAMFMADPEMIEGIDFDAIAESAGQIAGGLVIVDGRSLVADFASTAEMMAESAPLDLALLDRVPADSALLIQDNGLGDVVLAVLDLLEMADTMLVEMGILPLEELGPLSPLGPADLATFIRLSFEGSTGVNLDDLLAAMNGDFAVYLRLPVFEGENSLLNMLGFNVENGMVMAIDDPELIAEYVAATADQVLDMFNNATFEDGTLVLPLGDLLSMPEIGAVAWVSDDSVLASGSLSSVEFALAPSGDSIRSTDTYAYESALFLPETSTVWYIDMVPVRRIFEAFVEANPDMVTVEDTVIANTLLSIFDTSSITATDTALRLTLTLGE